MSTSPTLTITETEPTPLLRDFATLTQYLSTHPIVLTPTNEFISGKDLYALNQHMTCLVPNTTPKSSQTLYPLLHLFYHLILAGKLFQKSAGKGGRGVLQPTDRLQLYERLTPTEQYFALLEIFWVDADWAKLQGGYFGRSPAYAVAPVLDYVSQQQPGKTIGLMGGKEAAHWAELLWNWEYFLLYFSFFGLWDVTSAKEAGIPYSKRDFQAESITPSAFGVAMAPVLKEARDVLLWNLPHRREYYGEWKAIPGSPLSDEEEDIEHLFEAFFGKALKSPKLKTTRKRDTGKPGDPFFLPFVPLFAEGALQHTLPREGNKFVDGTYVFKVSLAKNLWRQIAVSANHTLLNLHHAIQHAFRFDDDHLYSFFMDGKPWSHEKFTSPDDDEGPHVDEVRVGELGLLVGQRILYLFDYGDQWEFQVTLEDIRTEGTQPRTPKILEQKGKAPEQYPDYDEYSEDDEE